MSKNKTINIDIHNKITANDLSLLLKTQVETIMANPEISKDLPPLIIHGAPGCGKSTIVKNIAKELGINFIDVRLTQMEPVDIRGLPVPNKEKNKVEWWVSADWPSDPDSKGILFFDEITAADKSIQCAAYELILDRRLGNMYKVPDGWYICAAGNRTEDRAVATSMSSALANRFMHVELESNSEDWIAWAQKHDINPIVTGFISYRPSLLFNQEDENLERGWPTPRAWERVSHMIDIYRNKEATLFKNVINKIVFGLVGDRAGTEFIAYYKANKNYESVLEMMTNPKAEIVIPETADGKYALCSAVAYMLWRGKDEQDEQNRITGLFRICMKLTPDFTTLCMKLAVLGNTTVNNCSSKILRHPMFSEWAEKFGSAFKKCF